MPQPFQDLDMQKFQNMNVEEMKKHLFRPAMPIPEMNHAAKIAELSHFLVTNAREHISPEEHVIDTAIRLLKDMQSNFIKYMELKADYDILKEKFEAQ